MKGTALGREGEEAACRYLEGQGYEVVARNFRAGPGEIDIIASRGDNLAFVEVKRWNAYSAEELERAVDARKRTRIRETSKIFLDRHRQYNCRRLRFDLILVSGARAVVRHLESALTE
jgi:putative endonuclease